MFLLNRENLHIRVFGMRRTMICLACSNALHSDHRSRSKFAREDLKSEDLKMRLIKKRKEISFVISLLETMFDNLLVKANF